jgi:hypothetical protein
VGLIYWLNHVESTFFPAEIPPISSPREVDLSIDEQPVASVQLAELSKLQLLGQKSSISEIRKLLRLHGKMYHQYSLNVFLFWIFLIFSR